MDRAKSTDSPACGGLMGIFGGHGGAIADMARGLGHRGEASLVSGSTERVSVGALGVRGPDHAYAGAQGAVCADIGWFDPSSLGVPGGTASALGEDRARGLLQLFQARGLAAIEQLKGEFALAIFEPGGDSLIMARDYTGAKPLHFAPADGHILAVASEYKAILEIPGVEPSVDRSMLQQAQKSKWLPPGRTLLQDIHAVPPGTAVRVLLSGKVAEQYQLSPPAVECSLDSADDVAALVRQTLLEALERRAGSLDVIGLALSGGIDSIGLAFALRQLYPQRPIHTFTAANGPDDPESHVAAEVARQIGAQHHTVQTPASALAGHLAAMTWHLEGPFSRSEALQLYLLGKEASEHAPVVLSAHGADALFAGMPRHRLLYWMKRWPPLAGALQEFYQYTQNGAEPRDPLARLLKLLKYRGGLPAVPRVLDAQLEPQEPVWPRLSPSFIDEVIAAASQSGMAQSEHKFERGFAASGVGHSSPFSDPELIRLAFLIDERLKIKGGVQKFIFRKALTGLVPDEFIHLPKYPQRMRYDRVFADELDRLARRLLSPEAVRRRGFFHPEDIARLLLARRRSGYADEAAMRIWTALLTELWAIQFLDGERDLVL